MKQIETKQRMKGESPRLCKLQMESRVLQMAKADSVINGFYFLNSKFASLVYYGATLNKFSVETPMIFF